MVAFFGGRWRIFFIDAEERRGGKVDGMSEDDVFEAEGGVGGDCGDNAAAQAIAFLKEELEMTD